MTNSIQGLCETINRIRDPDFSQFEIQYSGKHAIDFFMQIGMRASPVLQELYQSIICCKEYNLFGGHARFIPLEVDDGAPLVKKARIVDGEVPSSLDLVPVLDMLGYCRVFYAGTYEENGTKIFIEQSVGAESYFYPRYNSLDQFLEDLIKNRAEVFC
jgi:hypothetical protein